MYNESVFVLDLMNLYLGCSESDQRFCCTKQIKT